MSQLRPRRSTTERGTSLLDRGLRRAAPAVAAALLPLLGACENVGPTGTSATETDGRFEVRLQQADDASASAVSASLTEAGVRFSKIDMDAVEAVNVTIDEVEVKRVRSNGGDGPWVSLNVTAGSDTSGTDTVTVDLTDLPSGDSGLTVAVGDLDAGTYRNVRLYFTDAELVLSDSVTLGDGNSKGKGKGGKTFGPGTYDLFIPSGDQTGIKVPTAGFTLDEDSGGTVTLFADAEASIQNIEVTGRGFLMTPVLKSASDTADSDTTETDGGVDAVRVSPDSADVAVDDTVRFSAVATDAEGDTLDDAAFAWSSTDTTVATVDSAGLATGRAEGTARIVAESDGVADSADLSVTAPDDTASTSLSAVSGGGQNGVTTRDYGDPLVVEVTDGGGDPVAGATVTWTVTSGDASLSTDTVATDSTGRASVTVSAGTSTGPVTVEASTPDAAAVSFALDTSVALVLVGDNYFEDPTGSRNDSSSVSIAVGDTVLWEWQGSNPHTVTSDSAPSGGSSFDSGQQNSGTFRFAPQTDGLWTYLCEVHPSVMTGAEIEVSPSS